MSKVMLKSNQVRTLKKAEAILAVPEKVQDCVPPTPVITVEKLPPISPEDVGEEVGYDFTNAVRNIKRYRTLFLRCQEADTRNLLLRLMKIKKAEAIMINSIISHTSGIDNDNDVDGGEI